MNTNSFLKGIAIYSGLFVLAASGSLYQSCIQTDHITCGVFTDINVQAYDITTVSYKALQDSDEVFARKFAFDIKIKASDTICYHKNNFNLFNTAYATKIVSDYNIFMKDTIKKIEIYCEQNFNASYPAGSMLNNLFDIPQLGFIYFGNPHLISTSQMVVLNEIPNQSDYYRFYVKIFSQTNKTFIDTLPLIKILL